MTAKRECGYCGKLYRPKNSAQRFCRPKCRKAAGYMRWAKRHQALEDKAAHNAQAT